MTDKLGLEDTGPSAAEREQLAEIQRPPGSLLRMLMKAVLLFVAVVFVLVVTASYVMDYYGSRGLAAADVEARQRGIPLSFDEIPGRLWERVVHHAPNENAAVYYEAAFLLLERTQDKEMIDRLPVVGRAKEPDDPREPIPAAMLEEIRNCLAFHDDVLRLVHEGASMPACQYAVEWKGAGTLLPHLTRGRQAARLLALKMRLDAQDGDGAGGVTTVKDALALGESFVQEPFLISGLVGLGITSLTLGGAERLVARVELSQDQLAALQQQFESAAERFSFRPPYMGELVVFRDTYKRIIEGRGREVAADYSFEDRRIAFPFASHPLAWVLRGYLKADQEFATRHITKLIAAASNPTPEFFTRDVPAMESEIGRSPFGLSRNLLPALGRGLAQCEKARARLRAAAACVAALRYRNDTDTWPESLETLVPQYMKEVPIDPFTSKPLVYQVTAEGIMAYSIGLNLTDDGGKPYLVTRPEDVDEKEWARGCDDAGFRVWIQAQRSEASALEPGGVSE